MISKTECRDILKCYSCSENNESIDEIIKILNILAELEYEIMKK